MAYKVLIKKSIIKSIAKIPSNIQKNFRALVEVLQTSGTRGATGWPNFSKLDGNKYHCHLTYSYVVCWTVEKGTLTIEVYYVGSRESIIRLKPRTPLKVVQAIREQYSKYIEAVNDEDDSDELVDIVTTDWYKKMDSEMKPKDDRCKCSVPFGHGNGKKDD
jgi:mRNA-degrading endonuclease RelE of RelBE toxin-antitoxin system